MADRAVRIRLEAITSGFRNQFRSAAQTVRKDGRDMQRVAQQNSAAFTAMGTAVAGAGVALALGLRSAGREAAQFEATLTKSQTLIGVAEQDIRELGDAALRMSDTGRGPQELGEALFFVQSAGLRGAEALEVTEAAAKAAAIGLGDTATIADLVTSAVNAYGAETLSASQATDTLIGTVREGKAEATELAGSMGRVLPIASNMGISLDQVGAAMAAMTRTGTNAAESATQLRAIMVGLLKPAKDSDKALSEFGLSAEGLRATIKEDGLWQALQDVKQAVGDNDDAMARIFPNVRALAGVMDLTGASADATAEIFDNMTDTVGLTEEGFRTWSQTTEAAQQRFSASMEAAKIAAGESLQGPMKTVLDIGTGLNQMFVDLPGPAQTAATGLLGVGSSAGIVGGAFLLALPRIQEFKRALQAMGATRTLSALSSVKTMLMGPWGVALATATVAIGMFAKAKADQAARIEAVIATLDEETGALTENTDAWLLNRAEERRIIQQAEDLGISRGDVIAALRGEEDALAKVNEQLDAAKYSGNARAAAGLREAISDVNGELEQGQDEWRAQNEALAESEGRFFDLEHAMSKGLSTRDATLALRDVGDTADDAAGDAGDLAGGLDDVGDAAEEAVDPIKEFTDALDRLIGRHVDARGAQIRMLEAIEEVSAAVEENGTSLDINTEKGRDNLGVVHDSIDSILNLAGKRLEEGAAIDEVTGEVLGHIESLKEEMREAGFAEDAIQNLIDRYNLTPEEILTTIVAETGEAEAALDRLLGKLTALTGRGMVRVEGGTAIVPKGVTKHDGGWVTNGMRPPSDVAAMMGLRADEVPITAQTGELVLSRQQVSDLSRGNVSTDNSDRRTIIVQGDPSHKTVFRARDLAGL